METVDNLNFNPKNGTNIIFLKKPCKIGRFYNLP